MPNDTIEAEIFAVGHWNGRDYSIADLENIAANFRKYHDRIKPPLKLGHNEEHPRGQPALGWIKDLYVNGQKLVARFAEVPEIVRTAIKKGLYRRISSELWQADDDSLILKAVALLGADIPAVDNLEDLTVYFSAPKPPFSQTITLEFAMNNLKTNVKRVSQNFEELYNAEKTARLATEKKLGQMQLLAFEQKRAEILQNARLTCLNFTAKGLLPPYIKDLLLGEEGMRTSQDGTVIMIPFDIFVKLLEILPDNTTEKGLADTGKIEDDPAAEIDHRAKEIVEREGVDYTEATRRVLLHEKHLYDSYL